MSKLTAFISNYEDKKAILHPQGLMIRRSATGELFFISCYFIYIFNFSKLKF